MLTNNTYFLYFLLSAALAVVLGAVLILAFNVELPAELRAVLFYVQVRTKSCSLLCASLGVASYEATEAFALAEILTMKKF